MNLDKARLSGPQRGHSLTDGALPTRCVCVCVCVLCVRASVRPGGRKGSRKVEKQNPPKSFLDKTAFKQMDFQSKILTDGPPPFQMLSPTKT